MREPLVLLLLMASASGCCASRGGTHSSSPPATQTDAWQPSLSVEQASALPLDQAKAVLVARAALEQNAKRSGYPPPNVMAFRVTPRSPDGWEVYVEYVGASVDGQPISAPGYFCTVYIAGDWSVSRIVGGA